MKKQIELTACDCCGETLREPTCFYNDGGYDKTYYEDNNTELCFTCLGKIYEINLRRMITPDVLSAWVVDAKKRINKPSWNVNPL